ncbi:hypothetical protein MHBO_004831, partial [Bonamia ostreae]
MEVSMKTSEENFDNYTYFQYYKDLDLPVYLKCDLEVFSGVTREFLKSMRFEELDDKNKEIYLNRIKTEHGARILVLEEASMNVATQLERAMPGDRYGQEGITPRQG